MELYGERSVDWRERFPWLQTGVISIGRRRRPSPIAPDTELLAEESGEIVPAGIICDRVVVDDDAESRVVHLG